MSGIDGKKEVSQTQFQAIEEVSSLIAKAKRGGEEIVLSSTPESKEGKTAKPSKGNFRPSQDVSNDMQRVINEGTEGGPTLFSKWEGDALTLFMLDNAPLLMQLNFELRETLAHAQVSMSEAQIANSLASAEMKIKQGAAEKQKMVLQSASSFMSGTVGFAQMGSSIRDNLMSPDALKLKLDNTDVMIDHLNGPKMEADIAITATRDAATCPFENAADKADYIKTRTKDVSNWVVKDFQENYAAEMRDIPKEKRTQAVRVEAQHKAAKKTLEGFGKRLDGRHESFAGEPMNAKEMEFARDLLDKPEVAAEFMGHMDHEIAHTIFSADSPSVRIGVADPVVLGDQIMKSAGQSDKTAGFKAHVEARREQLHAQHNAADAKIERSRQEKETWARAFQGMVDGGTQTASAEQAMKIAEADAESRKDEVIAQNFASSRGSLDNVIVGALERVNALQQWYSQMTQAMAGALAQTLA